MIKQLAAATGSVLLLLACQKDMPVSGEDTMAESLTASKLQANPSGYVYSLSNEVSGNRVLLYTTGKDGDLTFMNGYPAGGTGTGMGLGNQGAIAMQEDLLLAVNPGSNTVSSFSLSHGVPQLVSTVSSGGTRPVSVTIHNNLVYVLNGGSSNISGFTLGANYSLAPIPNSSRPLSAANAGPAQVSFVAGGWALAITEKATNKITTYTVNANGTPGAMHTLTSANTTPFGFAVGKAGYIYVSEAAGGAPGASTVSSYYINNSGMISLADGPVSAGQTAACWVVMTNNGKYVYATNTGSNNITSFVAGAGGSLDVSEAVAGLGAAPLDAAMNRNSKLLFVLNSGDHSISAFSVSHDGDLTQVDNITGVPPAATGLVAK